MVYLPTVTIKINQIFVSIPVSWIRHGYVSFPWRIHVFRKYLPSRHFPLVHVAIFSPFMYKVGPYDRSKWSYNHYKWPYKWVTWAISCYIYIYSFGHIKTHEKSRFWPPKNHVIYHKRPLKMVGFGGIYHGRSYNSPHLSTGSSGPTWDRG